MRETYFEKEYLDVDYLNDYERTIDALEKQVPENARISRITFSNKDEYEEEYLFLEKYESFESLKEKFDPNNYSKVDEISLIYMDSNHLGGSIHINKRSNYFLILREKIGDKKEEATRPSKREIRKMMEEAEKESKGIVKEDKCIYYLFDNDIYGKYDPETSSYYILRGNGDWEVSGAVLRWVIDPAYDYEEVNNPVKESTTVK